MIMPDVQGREDKRELNIDMVGVKGVEWPIKLKDKSLGVQYTSGKFNMYVSLPKSQKGTHMSRFVEALAKFTKEESFFSMDVMVDEIAPYIRELLESLTVYLECEFTYFINVTSPETLIGSKLPIRCCFVTEGSKDHSRKVVEVKVPVNTLCPCSQEMSKNPHNQRGIVTIQADVNSFVWIEDLVEIAQRAGSCEIYPLLKRPDEKWVMDKSATRPRFVEDVVREASLELIKDKRIDIFNVECENMESIHPHSAFASIEWRRFMHEGKEQ
jgi:GTP cyclohydrolase I